MKKYLLYFFTVLYYVNSTSYVNAQCTLTAVGTPSNYATSSPLSDFEIAPNNMLYSVSYHTGDNKVYLHSTIALGNWSTVASLNVTTTVKPVLGIANNGNVYVFLRDGSNSNVGKVYLRSGASLVPVGSSVSGTNTVSDLSIAFNSTNDIYVAYTDVTNGNKSTVKKWNGSAWIAVGVSGGIVSSGGGYYNSLMIDKTDAPVLAYQDANNGNMTYVSRYTTAWAAVGSGLVGASATNQKIKVASSGDYYLGYTATVATGSAIVQKYSGSSWSQLGATITGVSSNRNTFDLKLDPTDMPYFITIPTTPPFPASYRYKGSVWSIVASNISVSVSAASACLAIDSQGSPYFFYVDQVGGNILSVKTLNSATSITTQPQNATVCAGSVGMFNIVTTLGSPTYQWQTGIGTNFINSTTPYSGATTPNLNFNSNPSLNGNKLRCVVDVGCKNIISNTAILTAPASLVVSLTSVNPSCSSSNDGSISSVVSGGSFPYSYNWTPGMNTNANITNLTAGKYVLNVTDVSGCNSSQSISLIAPAPLLSSFSGNMTICQGGTTTLSVNTTGGTGAKTYSWSPSTGLNATNTSVVTVNLTSTQTYTIQVKDSNGCVVTNTVMVTVNPTPTVTANTSGNILCQGNSTILTAAGANTYTWMPGNMNTASIVVSPPVGLTVYTVTGTYTSTGCSNTSTVGVTVNPIPTANAGPSGTLTCLNATISLSASTVGGSLYNWTGPGILAGNTTSTPTVNLPGTYSVAVSSLVGCVSLTSTVSVSQNTVVPTVNLIANPSTVCAGNNSILTATSTSDPMVNYSWNSGSLSGPTQTFAPLSTTSYSVVATNTGNGCVNTGTVNLTVNAVPVVTVIGGTSICEGSTSVLTASGAASYTWSSGATTSTLSITPTVTTTYAVAAENGNGCVVNTLATVSVVSSKDILGAMTNTGSTTNGTVILYKYISTLSQWDSIATVPFATSYSFNSVESGLYVVRAFPTASNLQVTYGDSALTWQTAKVINHGCTTNTTQNIKLIPFASFVVGPGELSGVVTEALGFGMRSSENKPLVPGNPIGGIIVKGGKNPGGQMFTQTTTAADGTYTLTGLPINSGSESYFVLVDIPGLDTNGTYHRIIATGNTQYGGLDFTVDSMYVNPVSIVNAISPEMSVLGNKITLFPNPAKQFFTITYELIQLAQVQIDLFDIIGNNVRTIKAADRSEKNKYSHVVYSDDLSNGIYFVKLKVNNSETVLKFIVAN